MSKVKKILFISFMIAATIVLTRFLSIRTPILTISFSFVPIIFTSIILGYKHSILVSVVADIIGALLFPNGAFFIGYTISALLTGLIYGLLLHNKKEFILNKKFIIKLIISIFLVSFLVNGVLNTIWILITVNDPSKIVVSIRIIKQLIMIPIIFIVTYSLAKIYNSKINEVLGND